MAARCMYTVEMDQEAAMRATASGGTVLLLDVPPGTLIGFDHLTFKVGPKFCGIKMLPPGVHLITSSSQGKDGNMGPVVGHFIQMEAFHVEVRRWSNSHEVLMKILDEDEEERYRIGVKHFDFDTGLAPYDLRSYGVWKSLSKYLDGDVIMKLSPLMGGISVMAEAETAAIGEGRTAAEKRLAEELQKKGSVEKECQNSHVCLAPDGNGSDGIDLAANTECVCEMPSVEGSAIEADRQSKEWKHKAAAVSESSLARDAVGRCRYTRLPTVIKRHGVSPDQLTALNLDKSEALGDVINKQMGGQESALLGEFQFAFISFLMCQSLEGFYQWKQILQLMLSCEEAPLHSHVGLFSKFLSVLCGQLQMALGDLGNEVPGSILGESFMEDIAEHNFLRQGLTSFLEMVQEAGIEGSVDSSVWKECRRLQDLVGEKMGWCIDGEEDDEYRPVVVDLGE